MARPTPFNRQTSFTQFSSNYPSKPQNGASLDAEFNAAKVALDETQANLALIQDDDGRLARGSVGRAQFDSSISLGFASPTPWAADTVYTAYLNTVWYAGKFYTCVEDHTSSGAFDTSKWFEVADLSASAAIDDGSINDAKLATSAVTSEKISPLAVTTPKIAASAITNPKLADGAVTRSKVDAAAGPDLAALIIPAGVQMQWPFASAAPTGWVLDGATYNRATYPALAALAVADAANPDSWFTVGDGSTTFGIKSAAGRALVGADASGSTFGAALTVGGTAGAATTTIAQANLPDVNFTVNIPSGQGSHGHTAYIPNIQRRNVGLNDSAALVQQTGSNESVTVQDATLPEMTGTAASGGSGTAISRAQPSIGTRFIFKAH